MPQALCKPVTSNIRPCLDGIITGVRLLAMQYHITIEYVPLPGADLGWFDPTLRVLRIRRNATIEDQAWLISELWRWITIGAHATHGARPQAHLQLVPQPRAAAS